MLHLHFRWIDTFHFTFFLFLLIFDLFPSPAPTSTPSVTLPSPSFSPYSRIHASTIDIAPRLICPSIVKLCSRSLWYSSQYPFTRPIYKAHGSPPILHTSNTRSHVFKYPIAVLHIHGFAIYLRLVPRRQSTHADTTQLGGPPWHPLTMTCL